ncbi:MAG: hypothetical protein AAFX06_25835 [Planctomycetota bacterium]
MPNPYDPPREQGVELPRVEPDRDGHRVVAALAFLAGCMLGFQFGYTLQQGPTPVLTYFLAAPVAYSLNTLIFAIVCFVAVLPYRFARSFFVPLHQVSVAQRFLSGFIMMGFGYTLNVILEQLSIVTTGAPTSFVDWMSVFLLFAVSAFVSVEFECAAAKRMRARLA